MNDNFHHLSYILDTVLVIVTFMSFVHIQQWLSISLWFWSLDNGQNLEFFHLNKLVKKGQRSCTLIQWNQTKAFICSIDIKLYWDGNFNFKKGNIEKNKKSKSYPTIQPQRVLQGGAMSWTYLFFLSKKTVYTNSL